MKAFLSKRKKLGELRLGIDSAERMCEKMRKKGLGKGLHGFMVVETDAENLLEAMD